VYLSDVYEFRHEQVSGPSTSLFSWIYGFSSPSRLVSGYSTPLCPVGDTNHTSLNFKIVVSYVPGWRNKLNTIHTNVYTYANTYALWFFTTNEMFTYWVNVFHVALRTVVTCAMHSECAANEYCINGQGICDACTRCIVWNDAIDALCPSSCTTTPGAGHRFVCCVLQCIMFDLHMLRKRWNSFRLNGTVLFQHTFICRQGRNQCRWLKIVYITDVVTSSHNHRQARRNCFTQEHGKWYQSVFLLLNAWSCWLSFWGYSNSYDQ
jgi:hypothetical protein